MGGSAPPVCPLDSPMKSRAAMRMHSVQLSRDDDDDDDELSY